MDLKKNDCVVVRNDGEKIGGETGWREREIVKNGEGEIGKMDG